VNLVVQSLGDLEFTIKIKKFHVEYVWVFQPFTKKAYGISKACLDLGEEGE